MREWSITKADWDRIASARPDLTTQVARMSCGLPLVTMLFALAVFVGASLTANPWFIGAAVIVAGAVLAVIARVRSSLHRGYADWDAMHPAVWESRGCVCPWCQSRVDRDPCVGHGFTTADQPTLLAYWEALALGDSATVMAKSDELQDAARTTPLATRANWSLLRPMRMIAPGMFDAERSPLARARAAWPVSLILLALLVLVTVVVDAAAGRRAAMVPITVLWSITLVPMALAFAWIGWKPGQPRCAACGHLCATPHPERCPECGVDLRKRHAVQRGTQARGHVWIWGLFTLIAWLAPTIAEKAIATLPVRARNAIYSVVPPPTMYFRDLDPTTLSTAEVVSTADTLIEGSQRGLVQFGWEFLPRAIASGKLPAAYREKAARASVDLVLEAGADPASRVVDVRVVSAWRASVLGLTTTVRLLRGGYSIDGGATWIPPGSGAEIRPDIQPWFRRGSNEGAADESTGPNSTGPKRTRIQLPSGGAHEIRARCWIITGHSTTSSEAIDFDERGAPILPHADMEAYEVELRTTVEVP